MEYLDQTFFSNTQIWIVKKKLKGLSYTAIKEKYKQKNDFNGTISDEAIKTCLNDRLCHWNGKKVKYQEIYHYFLK